MDVISLLRSTVESKLDYVGWSDLVAYWNEFREMSCTTYCGIHSDPKLRKFCVDILNNPIVLAKDDDDLIRVIDHTDRLKAAFSFVYSVEINGRWAHINNDEESRECMEYLGICRDELKELVWNRHYQSILFQEWLTSKVPSKSIQSAIVAQHKLLLTRHDEIQSAIDAKKKELDDLTLKCEAHHQELQTLTTLRIEYDVMRCDMISLKRQRDAYDHLDECVNKVNEYRESESKRLHEVDMMMQEDNASSLIRARTHLQKEFDDKRRTMFASVRDCQAKMKDAKERYEAQLKKLDQERQELLDEHQRLKSELDERSLEVNDRSAECDDMYESLQQRLTHPETILKSADSIIASSKIYETIEHIKSSSTLSQLSFDDISHLAEWMNYKLIVNDNGYNERHGGLHLDQLLICDIDAGVTCTIDETDVVAHSQTPFKDLPELMKVIAIMNKFKICLNDDHPDTAIKRFVYDFTSVIDRYLIEHLTEKR